MILLVILTLLLNFLYLVSGDVKSDRYFSIKKQISNIINIYKVNVLIIDGNVFYTLDNFILNRSNSINNAVHDINTFSIHQLQIIHSHSINLGRF